MTTAFTVDTLAALPPPEVIETLDYEAILVTRKGQFQSKAAGHGFDYNVIDLESDPGVINLEESSYNELDLRARGNEIARAPYLYYSTQAELDHLGAFYDCLRLPGEDDDRYRGRIILAIQGRSTGGTAPRYRSVAVSASTRVADAVVYTIQPSPLVHVAVYASDNGGVADQALLDLVTAAVTDPEVRMVNDTIVVESAVIVVQNIVADVTLLPNTSQDVLTLLENSLPTTWLAERGLGRDLTLDWIKGKIMAAGGVYKSTITTPATDQVMEPHKALSIGTVTLNFAGYAF